VELVRTALTAGAPAPAAPPCEGGSPRDRAADLTRGSFGERRVWRITCGDVVNRDRCLTVLVDRDQVVLVGPPGETAVLTAGQLGQLRIALREAAEQAER
jgi:hypothetical protein